MDKLIAFILDKFKASNPAIWGIIAAVLSIVEFAISKGNAFGLFPIEGITAEILHWVSWALALLVGSRTTNILNPEFKTELITAKAESEAHKDNFEELSKDYDTLHQYRNSLEGDFDKLKKEHEAVEVGKILLKKQLSEALTELRATKDAATEKTIMPITETFVPHREKRGRPKKQK